MRDLLDVRDVVAAYRRCWSAAPPGEVYNVARGEGLSLAEVFAAAAAAGRDRRRRRPPIPTLVRRADIPHLVGDPTKLRRATGWAPAISLDQTLQDLVDAEAD